MLIHSLTIQKEREKPEENQDSISLNRKEKIFCVCDGVTNSAFPRTWALAISDRFVQSGHKVDLSNMTDFKEWKSSIKKDWVKSIDYDKLDPLIRVMVEGESSACTFLGLRIKSVNQKLIATVFAVGDSNFFLIRNEKLIESFPNTNPEDFSNFTFAIESSKDDARIEKKEIHLKKNDIIVMATDTVAKWFLNEIQNLQRPWKKISKLNRIRYSKFIQKLRDKKIMEDDDCSIVIIRLR